LRAAIDRRRTTLQAIAVATEVDPKTVGRWLGGRVPHPRHRLKVAKLLGEDEEFSWPGASKRPSAGVAGDSELVRMHPYRSEMPNAAWRELISNAQQQIDLLGYTLYFLPMEHPQFIDTLRQKCANGCKIRAVIGHPESKYVADRDLEEDLALTLV